MKKINIGLLGCGTVGTGVAKILIENKELISSRVGADLVLKKIADIDTERDRGIKFDKGVFTTDPFKVIEDPDIDIIIEMIGGCGIANDLILKAIDNNKHIVTANKALIAEKGNKIFSAANKKGVDVAFEASVGGCIPVIKSLRESLVGNRIKSISGILNGTCNYILSKITNEGSTFNKALEKAQANGFAEADPTLDIEGIDAAHKIAILSSLAYGMELNFKDVYVEGITKITPADIEYAKQFGYKIKLLAISKEENGSVDIRVHPTMIPFNNLLSNVNGSLNAVTICGDAVGEILLYGHGAGMMPTASSVVGDTVDIARNILSGSSRRIPLLSYCTDKIKKIPIIPIDEISTNYYFRFLTKDRAGVLAKISGILGKFGISLTSVTQKGRKSRGSITIVMLTHKAKESDIKKAMSEISALDIISSEPVVIRLEDKNPED